MAYACTVIDANTDAICFTAHNQQKYSHLVCIDENVFLSTRLDEYPYHFTNKHT